MFSTKLVPVILTLILLTTQCQTPPAPTPSPTEPSGPPAVQLIPPIERGDGSDLLDLLLERGLIRVGIRVWPSPEFSPPVFRGFSNAETGGALNGFEVDIARQLAEQLGLELELVEAYPPVINSGQWQGNWDIALASLVPLDQVADLPAPTSQQISFSQPYGYMPMGFLIPAERDNIQTIADLSGRQVAVLEHSAYQWLIMANQNVPTTSDHPLLKGLPRNIQAVPVSNLSKAIQQLADTPQAVDFEAIFGPAPILEEAIRSDIPLKFPAVTEIASRQPLAVATVSQNGLETTRLITEINKILERTQRRGTLAEIYLRWYGRDLSIQN